MKSIRIKEWLANKINEEAHGYNIAINIDTNREWGTTARVDEKGFMEVYVEEELSESERKEGMVKQMKFYRMKEIATALTEVSMDTGYDYEYLCERFDECVEDGQTAEEAFKFVSGVSYEYDWDDEPAHPRMSLWDVAM